MRVVQLIDSLEAGGAEKMAIHYSNLLSDEIDFSGLITSRIEGPLKEHLSEKVTYLFLNKKKRIDVVAIKSAIRFIKNNKVDVIHAHSSSFFLGFLIKLILPKVKLIWHDHYGNSEYLEDRKFFVLKYISFWFNAIISVNENLTKWAKEKLFCKNIVYLPNFVMYNKIEKKETFLKGINGKRIICLANLRPQKNHELLIEVAKKIKITQPIWTFHLVGKDFNDEYSNKIKNLIKTNNLEDYVFVYGSKNDTQNILSQAEIGVLTSKSEGLPLAILEYGLNNLAVIATNVGQINAVVEDDINGKIIELNDLDIFYLSLLDLIENLSKREEFKINLNTTINEKYSKEVVITKIISLYKIVLNE